MYHKLIGGLIISAISISAIGQNVGINSTGTAPDASAALDVSSTTGGILVPRMTSVQKAAIAAPVEGLLVYDITTNSFWYHDGTVWVENAKVGTFDSDWTVSGTDQYSAVTGNVGVGVTAPANKLDISSVSRTGTHATGRAFYATGTVGANDNGFEFRHTNGSQGVGIGFQGIYATGANTSQPLNILSRGTGNVALWTNGAQRLTVLGTNGNVGIGTTLPSELIHISSTGNAKLFLEADTDNVTETEQPQILFAQDGGAVTGLVGFSGGTNHFRIANNYASSDADIDFLTQSAIRMTIDGVGNVGVGTTAPSDKLHVVGTSGNTLRIEDGNESAGKVLVSDATGNASWQNSTSASGRTVHTVDTRAGCPAASAANTPLISQTVTMAKNGEVQITSSIIRSGTNRHDLHLLVDGVIVDQTLTYTPAGSGNQWEDAHVHWSGSLTAGAHTVIVQGTTANSWGCGTGWGSIDTVVFD
jgi:hypothetical protein